MYQYEVAIGVGRVNYFIGDTVKRFYKITLNKTSIINDESEMVKFQKQ